MSQRGRSGLRAVAAALLLVALAAILIPSIGAALGRLIGEIWASVLIALAALLGGILGR